MGYPICYECINSYYKDLKIYLELHVNFTGNLNCGICNHWTTVKNIPYSSLRDACNACNSYDKYICENNFILGVFSEKCRKKVVNAIFDLRMFIEKDREEEVRVLSSLDLNKFNKSKKTFWNNVLKERKDRIDKNFNIWGYNR